MTELARGIDATLSIVGAAGKILDHKATSAMANRVGQTLGKLNTTTASIASYAAQTSIVSRMYIEESLLDEIVIPNFTRSVHEWNTAQVIAALGLSRMVDSKTTVQEVLSLVQTGNTMRQKSLLGAVAGRYAGVESFASSYIGESVSGDIGLESLDDDRFELVTKSQLDKLEKDRDDALLSAAETRTQAAKQTERFTTASQQMVEKHQAELGAHKKVLSTSSVSVKPVDVSKNRVGPMGELYEVKLTNPDGKGDSITVPVFIQMQPYSVPTDIAPRFIDFSVSPSLWQRWTQWKAGEISFVKDFIFQADLARRHQSVLKDPRQAKAMSEFLRTIAAKDKYALADISDRSGRRQSTNLANSVVVFSEATVAQAKVDSGIDLHNELDRNRYFRQTYTMIVAVIDPIHQRVTVYFHGIDGSINVPYSEFRPRDKNFEPKDFMAALAAFSTNSIGRLR